MIKLFTAPLAERLHAQYCAALSRLPARKAELDLLLCSLESGERAAMEYCYAHMPLSDLLGLEPQLLLDTVRHALFLYQTVRWAKDIPAGIFLGYVLYPRINNENITNCRRAFYDALVPRIVGKTAAEAAIEVNYWCLGKATYSLTDERTLSPVAVLRNAAGRCGEESTLTVTALRSVGIPARQVYAPKWAHCDDNHAWVECWTGGAWHYLGACEPEPELDRGWFTAAASKAMLVHSRIFSRDPAGEPVTARTPVCCTVNNTPVYARTKELKITVTDGVRPLPGIEVRFELLNYGEFAPVCTCVTGPEGEASLVCGLGDLHVHLSDGVRCLTRTVRAGETSCTLCFPTPGEQEPGMYDDRTLFDSPAPAQADGESPVGVFETEMAPPPENPAALRELPPDVLARHEARVAACNRARAAYEASFYTEEGAKTACAGFGAAADSFARALVLARGNAQELLRFIHAQPPRYEEKAELLDTLREKDFIDCTAGMLLDTLEAALPYRPGGETGDGGLPPEIYRTALLAPRVGDEFLLAVRGPLLEMLGQMGLSFSGPLEIWRYLCENTTLMEELEYDTLVADPRAVLRYGVSTQRANDLLFVTLCRTLGFPARLDPVSGRREYWKDGAYFPLQSTTGEGAGGGTVPSARLVLCSASGQPLRYGVQVTAARLKNGIYHTLQYPGAVVKEPFTLEVLPGEIRVLACARQIDGSQLCRAYHLRLSPVESRTLRVAPPGDRIREKLLWVPLPPLALALPGGGEESAAALLGHAGGVLAFLEPGKEPTAHLLGEILELQDRFSAGQVPLVLAVRDAATLGDPVLVRVLAALPNARAVLFDDIPALHRLHRLMGVGDLRPPFALAVGPGCKGLYAFANYNVGTADTLLRILSNAQGPQACPQ